MSKLISPASLIPLLAVCMFLFAGYHVIHSQTPHEQAPPPIRPADSPFAATVAGAGLVESRTENVEVASAVPGVVEKLFVREGDHVGPEDLLIRIESRDVAAELQSREAAVKAAEAELAQLQQRPRAEEIPASEAMVAEAESQVREFQDQFERRKRLADKGAATQEDLVKFREQLQFHEAALRRAKANDALLKAGTWEPDLRVAEAAVAQAHAERDRLAVEIRRHEVRAPHPHLNQGTFDRWEVLQVNIRPGEYASTPSTEPLMILGDTGPRRVRVDIDEHDLPRLVLGLPAVGYPRGEGTIKYPLRFVRVEPFVIPKRSLTGDNSERVDTRVLQLLYEFEDATAPVYVGQQMDVFIDLQGGAKE